MSNDKEPRVLKFVALTPSKGEELFATYKVALLIQAMTESVTAVTAEGVSVLSVSQ